MRLQELTNRVVLIHVVEHGHLLGETWHQRSRLMVRFYDIFVFTPPYESFIPADGVDTALFFPGGLDEPRNQGLVKFRHAVIKLAQRFQPDRIQTEQWPLSIET